MRTCYLNANLRKHFNNEMFYGNDMDRTMLRIGAMNMLLHGVDNPNISYRDSLSEQNADVEKYSLVLANPPFKGSLDHEAVSADLLKVTKTDSGGTDKVWFYDMKADGYSLDDKRQEISDCDIEEQIQVELAELKKLLGRQI